MMGTMYPSYFTRNDGRWAVAAPPWVKPKDVISVTRRDGSVRQVTIVEQVGRRGSMALYNIVQDWPWFDWRFSSAWDKCPDDYWDHPDVDVMYDP